MGKRWEEWQCCCCCCCCWWWCLPCEWSVCSFGQLKRFENELMMRVCQKIRMVARVVWLTTWPHWHTVSVSIWLNNSRVEDGCQRKRLQINKKSVLYYSFFVQRKMRFDKNRPFFVTKKRLINIYKEQIVAKVFGGIWCNCHQYNSQEYSIFHHHHCVQIQKVLLQNR